MKGRNAWAAVFIALGLGAGGVRAAEAPKQCVDLPAETLAKPLDDTLKMDLARKVVRCKPFSEAMFFSSPQGYLKHLFEQWTLTPAAHPPEALNPVLNARNEAEFYYVRAIHELQKNPGAMSPAEKRELVKVRALNRNKSASRKAQALRQRILKSLGLTANRFYVAEAYVGAVRAAQDPRRTPNNFLHCPSRAPWPKTKINYRKTNLKSLAWAYGHRPGALSVGKPVPLPASALRTSPGAAPGPRRQPSAPPSRVSPRLIEELGANGSAELGKESFIDDCLKAAIQLVRNPKGAKRVPGNGAQTAALSGVRGILESQKLRIGFYQDEAHGAKIEETKEGFILVSIGSAGVRALQDAAKTQGREVAVEKGAAYLIDQALALYAYRNPQTFPGDAGAFKRDVIGVRL